MTSNNVDFDLWPVPSLPPSRTSPSRLPGVTPGSTQALREVLRRNHENWHVFFDDFGRHNHISHRVLAAWAMGAQSAIVREGYDTNEHMQKPRGTSPGQITPENFKEHLGDRRFYDAYVRFYTELVRTKGFSFVLEEYVFSPYANFASTSKDGKRPEMLGRFCDGLLHPMIHAGYGVEFGLPGMFVEGLAMTSINPFHNNIAIPPDLFASVEVLRETPTVELPNTIQQASTRLKSVLQQVTGSPTVATLKTDVHAFDVLARIIDDPEIARPSGVHDRPYRAVIAACGNAIYRRTNEWSVTPSSIQAKIEEAQWAATLLYAISGFNQPKDGGFNADFLAYVIYVFPVAHETDAPLASMHFVTSALFLPSFAAYLSPPSQVLLLRSYLTVCIAWWVSLGKPRLDIPAFFAAGIPHTATVTSTSRFSSNQLSVPRSQIAGSNPNPWTAVIRDALIHPDDHVPKLVRSLVHFGALYGGTEAGHFGHTELKGAEQIDGTLFVRAAELTMARLGREFKVVPPLQIYWDRVPSAAGAKNPDQTAV
ncbi:hypothetical protein PQX77_007541 [Marasmius sp. AFHP31]|nr:hypothetical protein PQX77_007541 [Marasmius sp. AFHP31]